MHSLSWMIAVFHTAGQVLWQDIGEEGVQKESKDESKDESKGDHDPGEESSNPRKYWQGLDKFWKFRFDLERVELGGEGAGLGGEGGGLEGLEGHHWADVGAGLHVHAVVVVQEEGLW